uniref:Uncharacterized protein n=1 Tax=Tetraselmis sp. GSL018 TaxID=582737 RepID=A0A061RCP5_9CHLO
MEARSALFLSLPNRTGGTQIGIHRHVMRSSHKFHWRHSSPSQQTTEAAKHFDDLAEDQVGLADALQMGIVVNATRAPEPRARQQPLLRSAHVFLCTELHSPQVLHFVMRGMVHKQGARPSVYHIITRADRVHVAKSIAQHHFAGERVEVHVQRVFVKSLQLEVEMSDKKIPRNPSFRKCAMHPQKRPSATESTAQSPVPG